MRTRRKSFLNLLIQCILIVTFLCSIVENSNASKEGGAAFEQNRVLNISKESTRKGNFGLNSLRQNNYEDTDSDDSYQINCNHLHCSDGTSIKDESTVCPELQNATFTGAAPFDGLGQPRCNVPMEMSLYLPHENGSQINNASCEMTPTNFPNEATQECIRKLGERKDITKVVWIIHGYWSSDKAQWLHEVKDNIQSYDNQDGKVAVILLGWGEFDIRIFDQFADYVQSAKDTRYVGHGIGIIANAIKREVGRDLYFHCIGHSLGAHVCGFGGKQLKRQSNNKYRFNRISGLDPAGPVFCANARDGLRSYGPPKGSQYCIDPEARLHNTDADFVDVIHTDGRDEDAKNNPTRPYGTLKTLGDIDLYPGMNTTFGSNQPGCDWGDDILACSHVRSYRYFSDSIKNNSWFPFTSRCQNSYPQPSNCVTIDNKVPEFGLAHHRTDPVPKMGYWLDRKNEGIYTINVKRYCDMITAEFVPNFDPLHDKYCTETNF